MRNLPWGVVSLGRSLCFWGCAHLGPLMVMSCWHQGWLPQLPCSIPLAPVPIPARLTSSVSSSARSRNPRRHPVATDSIDRVKRPFLRQKAATHFQMCRRVVDSEFSKALLNRSHMVILSHPGNVPQSSSQPRSSPWAPLCWWIPALCWEPSTPVANLQDQKLQGYLGAFPIMESDVFNWLIWAWHPAGAPAEPSHVNPPPLGLGPRAAGWEQGFSPRTPFPSRFLIQKYIGPTNGGCHRICAPTGCECTPFLPHICKGFASTKLAKEDCFPVNQRISHGDLHRLSAEGTDRWCWKCPQEYLPQQIRPLC